MESTHEKEINKRFGRWIRRNRTRLLIGFSLNVVAFILLFTYYSILSGITYAVQNTFQELSAFFLLEGLGLLGWLFYHAYYVIPEEVYKEQKEVIDERLPGKLNLTLERTPNTFTPNGEIIHAAALYVTSNEKKKIVELQAILSFEFFYCDSEGDYVGQASYRLNTRLGWGAIKAATLETELLPNIGQLAFICDLVPVKTENGDSVWMVRMGGSPVPWNGGFSKESISQIAVLFQGKLEGDYDFRTFHYNDFLYAKPSERQIMFLDEAENARMAISAKLLERGRRKVVFLEER